MIRRRWWVTLTGGAAAAGMLLAGCSRANGGATAVLQPSATPPVVATLTATARITTPAPSPTLTPEQVVLAAYGRFWEAYGRALLDLDAALVEPVAAGERLQQIQEEVEGLRRQGVAARVTITHNPVVIELSETTAIVNDQMVNHSVYVNPQTKQPSRPGGSGDQFQDTSHLRRVDGVWKVVSSTRLISR